MIPKYKFDNIQLRGLSQILQVICDLKKKKPFTIMLFSVSICNFWLKILKFFYQKGHFFTPIVIYIYMYVALTAKRCNDKENAVQKFKWICQNGEYYAD